MIFEEMLKEEHAEGREEGLEEGLVKGRSEGLAKSVLKLLEKKGDMPEEIKMRIWQERDEEVLADWLMLAAESNSVSAFCEGARLL